MSTPDEAFEAKMAAIPDSDLAKEAKDMIAELASSYGRSHRMSIPPRPRDTDMLLSEVVRRFEALAALRSPAKEEEPMETSKILGHAWVAQGINGEWICQNCGRHGGNSTAPFNSWPCRTQDEPQHPFPMSTPTEQAIEALEKFRPCDHGEYEECGTSGTWRTCNACGLQFAAKRHDAIRKRCSEFDDALLALRSPAKEEPVAWTTQLALDVSVANRGISLEMIDGCARNLWGEKDIPLYTHPQPKPTPVLTVEQAMEIASEWAGDNFHCENKSAYRDLRSRLTAKATTTP